MTFLHPPLLVRNMTLKELERYGYNTCVRRYKMVHSRKGEFPTHAWITEAWVPDHELYTGEQWASSNFDKEN